MLSSKTAKEARLRYQKKEIEIGHRNVRLAQIAGRYRARGLDIGELTGLLLEDNYSQCKPPLSEREVRTIAESICRYEKGSSKASFKEFWLSCIYNDRSGLKAGVKATLTAISFLMDEHGGNCTATQELIGAKAGSNERTVNRHIKTAVNLGWLKQFTLAKTNGTQGAYCRYLANVPGVNDEDQ